jgi:hypothetical protein
VSEGKVPEAETGSLPGQAPADAGGAGRPLVPGPPQSVRPPIRDTTINRSFIGALLASLIVIVALLVLFVVITVAVLRRLGQLH